MTSILCGDATTVEGGYRRAHTHTHTHAHTHTQREREREREPREARERGDEGGGFG